MLTNILVLALAIHGSIAAPSQGEPVLDALAAQHNIAVQDRSYTAVLPQVIGEDVVLQKKPVHFDAGFVGTPTHPIPTGQVIGKHVETFAIGQQSAHAEKVISRVTPHVETQVITKSVQVPVQTVQTVQVPSVQYQTVQVPVHVQKEIVEVEKPVPVVKPVPVETPPKPYVKEVVYARPFQVSQKYVKTRVTPLEEVTDVHNESTTTHKPEEYPTPESPKDYPTPKPQTFVDFTEENLYYANRKRKVVTKFIKIEEYYEAATSEEVGVYYSYGHTDGDNFDFRVTRIFEVDQPILVKNLTTTTKVSNYRSPVHVIHEYVNDKLVHSFPAGKPLTVFQGHNATESHFIEFHSSGPFKPVDQLTINKYTDYLHGKQVEIEERTYVLQGGHALFVEKRISPLGDFSASSENLEPVPSFEITNQNGKRVLKWILTYDSTRTLSHAKYGVAASESFGNDFASFLEEFKKHISSDSSEYHRIQQSIETVEKSSRKKRSVEIDSPAIKKNITETVKVNRKKREPRHEIQYHNKIYHLDKKLVPKGYTPGGFIYKSDDGSEIKVEEETIYKGVGSPKNEYLRFSQIYVPRKKVKYEVAKAYNYPIEWWLGDQYESSQSYPFSSPLLNNNGFSYKYGSSKFNPPISLL